MRGIEKKAMFKKIKNMCSQPMLQCIIIEIVILFSAFQMVEFCNSPDFINRFNVRILVFNILTYLALWLLFKVMVGKWWIADVIVTIFLAVFSIANYYVILFHGAPLSFSEFANFKTAMSVIGSYSFPITKRIIGILILAAFQILLSLLIKKREKKIKKISIKKIWINIITLFVVFLFLIWGYVSDYGYKYKLMVEWTWYVQYQECGVFPCFLESFIQGTYSVQKPDGYTIEKVREIQSSVEHEDEVQVEYPDIIFVLNESFYDLDYITKMDTDKDYLYNWRNLENKITGYAVSTMVGGGTNCSEYEILTSNSLQLLGRITPFTTLKLQEDNSVASFLKNKGYYTLAAHPSGGIGYMRDKGYSALGFDEAKFVEDFENLEVYYERNYPTDESVYKNLTKWYEQMPQGPRFLFVLTFQNHGDWCRNDSKYDIVHTNIDYGDYTDDVNEYLSCIYMSDEAFDELIRYYEEINRPVIICMVGDHAPTLVKDITDTKYSDDEKELRQRSVPFVIWSNKYKFNQDIGTISMIYLIPTMLKEAGIPLSDYYEYLLKMKNDVPVLTSYGVYYDKDGTKHTYDEKTEYTEEIENYFILEYNNVCDKKGQVKELFQ